MTSVELTSHSPATVQWLGTSSRQDSKTETTINEPCGVRTENASLGVAVIDGNGPNRSECWSPIMRDPSRGR
jgi:hypothetical protein